MQATIYISDEAMTTANAIKNLSYHERMMMSDEIPDLTTQAGYFLKNATKLNLAVLPATASVGLRLIPEEPAIYHRHVSIPTNLRGCVFANAPHLPDGYAEIVTYWSGTPVNTNTSGAAYFQNPQNEYLVDLSALDAADGDPVAIAAASAVMDNLLSEGIIVCIKDVQSLISGLSPDSFIELSIPVNQSFLGIEPDEFQSGKIYTADPSQQYEDVWIQCADILRSPDPDRIFVELIRHDLIDYGYWY
jgi:hypothetical protein